MYSNVTNMYTDEATMYSDVDHMYSEYMRICLTLFKYNINLKEYSYTEYDQLHFHKTCTRLIVYKFIMFIKHLLQTIC